MFHKLRKQLPNKKIDQRMHRDTSLKSVKSFKPHSLLVAHLRLHAGHGRTAQGSELALRTTMQVNFSHSMQAQDEELVPSAEAADDAQVQQERPAVDQIVEQCADALRPENGDEKATAEEP